MKKKKNNTKKTVWSLTCEGRAEKSEGNGKVRNYCISWTSIKRLTLYENQKKDLIRTVTNRYCTHVFYHQDVKATCLNKGMHGNLRSLCYDGSLSSRSFSFSFVCPPGSKAVISAQSPRIRRLLLCSEIKTIFVLTFHLVR